MDEDKIIVENVLKGNKDAFEMIIMKYQTPLLNYIGRMVSDRQQALDFTQEIFIDRIDHDYVSTDIRSESCLLFHPIKPHIFILF